MNKAEQQFNKIWNRAKNLQEFTVVRDMEDILFDGNPIPYTMQHKMGEPVKLIVPAISQEEAEQRVNTWLKGQRV